MKKLYSPLVLILCGLSIFALCFLATTGCRPKASPTAVTAEGGSEAAMCPFPGGSAIDSAVASARGAVSEATSNALGRLHISGLVVMLVAVSARFILGSWKDAFIAAGLTLVPSAIAVLLAEYSRVVLLIPLCGISVLIACAVRKIAEWFTGYRAWKAVAAEIEGADTGRYSLGQLVKNRFKEAGLAPVIDPALKPLETKWSSKHRRPH